MLLYIKPDQKTKILIEVTQDDITNGIRQSATNCMVSRAAMRVLSYFQPTVISCNPRQMHIFGWKAARFGYKEISFDSYVTSKIRAFDGGYKVEPFSFEIEI